VGLLHYDKNHSGSIEPSDMELSADLFSRLDVSKQHKISPRDLTTAIDQMEKQIDMLNHKISEAQLEVKRLEEERDKVVASITNEPESSEELDEKLRKLHQRRLKAEELEVEIKKKLEHSANLMRERAREEAMLNETVGVFRRGFVESLFLKLGGKGAPTAEHTRRYEMMSEELERIERQLRALQLEIESRSPKSTPSRLSSGPAMTMPMITSTAPATPPKRGSGTGEPEQPSGHSNSMPTGKYQASSKEPQEARSDEDLGFQRERGGEGQESSASRDRDHDHDRDRDRYRDREREPSAGHGTTAEQPAEQEESQSSLRSATA